MGLRYSIQLQLIPKHHFIQSPLSIYSRQQDNKMYRAKVDYLPLFIELKNRPVLVVGGGNIAARKIALLLRAQAKVQLVAEVLVEEVRALIEQHKINWIAKCYAIEQLDNVFLVIAATNNPGLNQAIYQHAQQRLKLVNVVDEKQHCSFIFPAIVDRSPIVVAISSAGTAPVMARIIREKLEALLPNSIGVMARMAGRWRTRVKQKMPSVQLRRRFWEQLFQGNFANLMASGKWQAAEHQLVSELQQPRKRSGELSLVGAGPGDPSLLTLRALQVLQQADVVLYDHLVTTEVLELVRRDAERICVGKRAGSHSFSQQVINQQIVTLAQQGLRVVRLKGGDPFIFGRGGEELEAALAAKIPFQVVPGITAAVGATAYAGIPLTHRDYAQSVVFITGHCRADGALPDWPTLALSHQTLAIYMGILQAAEISRNLIKHGRAATTPVAIISRGTCKDQQVVLGSLGDLAKLAADVPTPGVIIIGEVVNLHEKLAWFQTSTKLAMEWEQLTD